MTLPRKSKGQRLQARVITKRMKRKHLRVSITAHRRYYEPATTYSTSYQVRGASLR